MAYPESIPAAVTANVDKMKASWANAIRTYLTSLETELGSTPKGAFTDASDRMAMLEEMGQPGYLRNGKLSVTVVSDDLIVAIKGLDGNNPSATNPVRVRIGDVEHTLTAALSVTIAAGDKFQAGTVELRTNAVGFFVYLGYNSTDGVTIGAARIPWARQYSDFSTTATDEDYCAISDISNASASDAYQVVGYFEAENSGGAGYTWSNVDNVISEPRDKTNVLTYKPTPTGFSGTPTVADALYQIVGKRCNIDIYNASGTSNATGFTLSLPYTAAANPGSTQSVAGYLVDNSAALTVAGRTRIQASTNICDIYSNMSTGTWTASGTKQANFNTSYLIA